VFDRVISIHAFQQVLLVAIFAIFSMDAGFLERYFGGSSATETASDDLDDLVWICVRMLECTHPPNTSFEEIMATAARVRSQRSGSNPSIALPSSVPQVRQKLRELALALNPLASDQGVVLGRPTESPTVSPAGEENPEAQGILSPDILENSDEDSGWFPHVERSSPAGLGHHREVELPRKRFQPPSNQEVSVGSPQPGARSPSKGSSAASGTPAQDARLTRSAEMERPGDRRAD